MKTTPTMIRNYCKGHNVVLTELKRSDSCRTQMIRSDIFGSIRNGNVTATDNTKDTLVHHIV